MRERDGKKGDGKRRGQKKRREENEKRENNSTSLSRCNTSGLVFMWIPDIQHMFFLSWEPNEYLK